MMAPCWRRRGGGGEFMAPKKKQKDEGGAARGRQTKDEVVADALEKLDEMIETLGRNPDGATQNIIGVANLLRDMEPGNVWSRLQMKELELINGIANVNGNAGLKTEDRQDSHGPVLYGLSKAGQDAQASRGDDVAKHHVLLVEEVWQRIGSDPVDEL